MGKKSAKSKHTNTIHFEAKQSILHLASKINQVNYQVLKPFNISLPQFHVMRILYKNIQNKMTITQITDKMVDKMPNTSRIVDRLHEKGLVDKENDESDKRKINISLTEAGILKMKKIIPTIESSDLNIMEKLTVKELKQLRDISQKINTEVNR